MIFLLSYALYAEVLRENVWLSRTVEVQKGQKVVDTGLYAIVRHPMYMATAVLFLSMPLVLGSSISFVIMLAYLPIIAKRIRNEVEVLEEGLEGYSEYKEKVKYRLIPFVWQPRLNSERIVKDDRSGCYPSVKRSSVKDTSPTERSGQ